ncbi:MAG: PRC-barrel domain-containing protein [Gammaproteobacteria bacterium]
MGILHKLKRLQDYRLQARDGEIGDLREIYFDDQVWTVRYLVVRTGGWLFGREVLIAPCSVTGLNEETRTLVVDLTQEQIKGSPPITTQKPVSRHYEQAFYQYYHWIPYWYGEPFLAPGMPPASAELPKESVGAPENPHLRSSHEVHGYHLNASNGEFGHVADFIVDQQDWQVRYLEIDTRNWWPGKHVLVAPTWIQHVSWGRKEIAITLSREAIESAPSYDSSKPITPDYEIKLYKHYGLSPQDS